jgi:hypothetical protein
MRIRINLTEAKKPVDPKKVAADKKAEAKKVADKKKADDKKKAEAKKKLKESLYPVVRKMLAENANIEETELNEGDPSLVDWNVVAMALGAVGLAPVLINKIHDLWKKKFPESFKKAQSFTKAMDDVTGANK